LNWKSPTIALFLILWSQAKYGQPKGKDADLKKSPFFALFAAFLPNFGSTLCRKPERVDLEFGGKIQEDSGAGEIP
jgi:hypothetical protein